jgi:hypothetical protein
MIKNSVFRLAARRTGLGWLALELEAAPVSEKTCWTKPPPWAGLWALKAIGSPDGAGNG